MIKKYLEKLIAKENLSVDESFDAMNLILLGGVIDTSLSAFLVALKMKNYHPDEINGFVKAMHENSIKINSPENVIDLCGTGGDSSNTFNISTAAAFIVAGAGIPVAKHGNKAVSSLCGSADLLSSFGVNINTTPQAAEKILNEIGICFLYAPIYHPAMKHAVTVRKDLGMKTVFNLLGPLTNPAGVKRQIVGVYDYEVANLLSNASSQLEYEKICFICTDNQFDEFIPCANLLCSVYEDGKDFISTYYEINSEHFQLPSVEVEKIKCISADENSKMVLSILEKKEKNDAYHTAVANAALAIYVAGKSDDFLECKMIAEESIQSGRAFDKLKQMIELSNR